MNQSYTPILNVLFDHSFFSSGLMDSLRISWEADSSNLMKNFQLICKSIPGGLCLLSRKPELLESNEDDIPLRFSFDSKDELFFNYTDLAAYNPSKDLLYFNNKNKPPTLAEQPITLHSTTHVDQNEIYRLTHNSITIEVAKGGPSPKFYDGSGNPLSDDNIVEKVNYSAIESELSDKYNKEYIIKNITQGPINMTLKDYTEQNKFYYYPKSIWKKPLGIVEIYPSELSGQLKEQDQLQYQISFENRKTKWKYFLMDPGFQRFENLSVVNKKDKKEICRPEANQLTNAEGAKRILVSSESIPLIEKSDDIFQLVHNHLGTGNERKVVINNLPRASPEQLFHPSENSDKSVYSHIYI